MIGTLESARAASCHNNETLFARLLKDSIASTNILLLTTTWVNFSELQGLERIYSPTYSGAAETTLVWD